MRKEKMKIGVLALQGAFIEHTAVIRRLGAEPLEVRLPVELDSLDGLIIPGGESTTILKLMHGYGIFQPLKRKIENGFPVLGTCAGLICLAKRVFNSQESVLEPLEVMDIEVKRNAFGRQVDSFETDLPITALGDNPYHAVFIRAPLIEKVGPQVKVLANLPDGTIVAAQQGKLLVTTFHPELADDTRFHEYFLKLAALSPAQE
jgi:pyridoxal 5'-phosphate synthase pdxT subunit